MVAGERVSNGTTTAKQLLQTAPNARTREHRNAMVRRQVRQNAHFRQCVMDLKFRRAASNEAG